MNIKIEPIPFGLDDKIVSIELQWCNNKVLGGKRDMILQQFNQDGNLVYERKIEMDRDSYNTLGQTTEERVSTLLQQLNIKKIEYESNS